VTTTLNDLESAAGKGLTGGGSLLPMPDVMRMARHAHHYLAIFDKGQALALYHTKRLASPGQRIVLYANKCADCALLDTFAVGRFKSCRGHSQITLSHNVFRHQRNRLPIHLPIQFSEVKAVSPVGRPSQAPAEPLVEARSRPCEPR
jgi:hypothetical protein